MVLRLPLFCILVPFLAQIQLALASLSLEEGRAPAEQEAIVRQAIESFQQQHSRDDEIEAWCILARVLLAEGKTAEANDAVHRAQSLVLKSQNPEVQWRASITAARVATIDTNSARSASGTAARRELADVIAKSHQKGYGIVELDARFAMAEIESKAGGTKDASAQLASIKADAKAKGYHLSSR